MKNKNFVQLIGQVGSVETKTLESGKKVSKISLATNETFKAKDGQKVTNTQWHQLTAWNGLSEIAEKYVQKGQALMVEGSLNYSSYEDKEGIQRYTTEIVLTDINILTKKD